MFHESSSMFGVSTLTSVQSVCKGYFWGELLDSFGI